MNGCLDITGSYEQAFQREQLNHMLAVSAAFPALLASAGLSDFDNNWQALNVGMDAKRMP